MATNKTINVQYKLRGDTLENLEAKNAVYGMHEPIIVNIPKDSEKGIPAATLLKMGDGVTSFNDLPYVTALAGDVPDWAKQENKPTYTAEEISGIDAYISGKIGDTDTQYKLEQDETDPRILKLYAKGLNDSEWRIVSTITTAASAVIDVVRKTTANDGYAATYQITVDGVAVGEDINIPKDFLVKSGVVNSVATPDDPYTGAVAGDTYIDFVVNVPDADGEEQHIYLPVKDLVDPYTAGDGIDISDTNVVSVKLGESKNGLSVGKNGLELTLATDTTAGAMSAADHAKLAGMAEGATKVEVSETNGNVVINGTEQTVYTLPDTVVQYTDDILLDGGNA